MIVDFHGVFNGAGHKRQPSKAELSENGIDVARTWRGEARMFGFVPRAIFEGFPGATPLRCGLPPYRPTLKEEREGVECCREIARNAAPRKFRVASAAEVVPNPSRSIDMGQRDNAPLCTCEALLRDVFV
jgi:hypothetical protein